MTQNYLEKHYRVCQQLVVLYHRTIHCRKAMMMNGIHQNRIFKDRQTDHIIPNPSIQIGSFIIN